MARFCVDPAAIVAEATWKVERVKTVVIQYRQDHIAVRWSFLEDEMPHGTLYRTRWQGHVDLGQIGSGPLGLARLPELRHMDDDPSGAAEFFPRIFDLTQCCAGLSVVIKFSIMGGGQPSGRSSTYGSSILGRPQRAGRDRLRCPFGRDRP